jgi:hypothetical protein
MFMLVIQHQSDRSLAHFGGKLVRRLAHGGSSFSGVEPSGKPRVVQLGNLEARFPSLIHDATLDEK